MFWEVCVRCLEGFLQGVVEFEALLNKNHRTVTKNIILKPISSVNRTYFFREVLWLTERPCRLRVRFFQGFHSFQLYL